MQPRDKRLGGPKPKHTMRCPDCELRDALNAVGLPRFHPHYGFRLTIGCEECEGTGRVPMWRR